MTDALIQGGAALLAAVLSIGHGVLIWQFSQFNRRLLAVEARSETADAKAFAEVRGLESQLAACKLAHAGVPQCGPPHRCRRDSGLAGAGGSGFAAEPERGPPGAPISGRRWAVQPDAARGILGGDPDIGRDRLRGVHHRGAAGNRSPPQILGLTPWRGRPK